MLAPLVGTYFRPPAQPLVERLPIGVQLRLDPEPENPHDKNAIRVSIDVRLVPEETWQALENVLVGYGTSREDMTELCSKENDWMWQLGYIARTHNERVLEIMLEPFQAKLAFNPAGKPMVEASND